MKNPIIKNSYKFLAKSLGVFWIIDGLLQLQPKMFGQQFVSNVLAANLSGQPGFMQWLINFGIKVFSLNTVASNIVIIIIQLGIGALLLLPIGGKKFRCGLYLSVIWGLIVWIFGEGAGNLLTGSANFFTGAPGSVVIYILLAILLLAWNEAEITTKLLSKICGLIFILFAALQFQTIFWTQAGIQSIFQGSIADAMPPISAFASATSNLLSPHPITSNLILILIPVILGVFLIAKPNRAVAILTFIFLFLSWWLGQDFGALSTTIIGTTTDPNTAPLLILFVLPLLFNGKNYFMLE